jgi:hypothetical protein
MVMQIHLHYRSGSWCRLCFLADPLAELRQLQSVVLAVAEAVVEEPE